MKLSRRTFITGVACAAGGLTTTQLPAIAAKPGYRGIPLRVKTVFAPPEIITGNSFDVTGDVLYIANRASDFVALIDISVPANPRVLSTARFDGQAAASSVSVTGDLAVTTDVNNHAVGLIDVSNSTNPQPLGSVASSEALLGAWHVQTQGTYAYVACRGSGSNGQNRDGVFSVVDIADPANPTIVAVVHDELTPEPRHLQVRGKYVYLVDEHRAGDFTGQGSFQVFDIENPRAPQRVAYLATPELLDARKSALKGSTAIVCGRDVPDARIVSIDITNPRQPVQLDAAGADQTRYTHGVSIAGNYAYMASTVADSVSAWDISDPTNLRLGALLSTSQLDDASELVAHRNHLFVWSRAQQGLAVLG